MSKKEVADIINRVLEEQNEAKKTKLNPEVKEALKYDDITIPTHNKNQKQILLYDLNRTDNNMSKKEILLFAVEQCLDFLRKENYSIDKVDGEIDKCPNIIAHLGDEKVAIFAEGGEVREQPVISKENKKKLLDYAKKHKVKPLYASFGIGAANHERFAHAKLIPNDPDGYYINFTGFEEVDNSEPTHNILSQEYVKLMKNYRAENDLKLSNYECECYANFVYVLDDITDKKLQFNQLIEMFDFFTDILDGNYPEITMFTVADSFKGFYRLLKRCNETKYLNDEQMKLVAYAIYQAYCIKVYDEKTQTAKWNMELFDGGRKALEESYKYSLKQFPNKFTIKKYSDELSVYFGKSVNNPIEVVSIPMENVYLDLLVTSKGKRISYRRVGSCVSEIEPDLIVDKYEIFIKRWFGKKTIDTLYITPYGFENSLKAPLGFKFID